MKNTITGSLEDYLEVIYNLFVANIPIKVTEIAKILNVQKASVCDALKTLAKFKLINYKPYNPITLTFEGENIAKEIAHKHSVLEDFLCNILGINTKEAKKSACKIEHIIDEEVFNKLVDFIEFIKSSETFQDDFNNFCTHKLLK